MKKGIVLMLIALVAIGMAFAQGSPETATKTEGPKQLTMYIGVVEEQAMKIAEEFEKAS